MPVLTIGDTAIPYDFRRSPRAKHLRITVRPGRVEVVAPRFMRKAKIRAFIESKRRWIFERTEVLRERQPVATPQEFVSGAKVLFRGRFLRLRVDEVLNSGTGTFHSRPRPSQSPNSLRFANAFNVTVEPGLTPEEREQTVRALVIGWLKKRAKHDAESWTQKYGGELGVYPTNIQIRSQKTRWGSCSARGVISLNWRLVAAPKPVFEYVVVHELCHLVEPNHGTGFWRMVGELMPEYRERRAWLKKHAVALG